VNNASYVGLAARWQQFLQENHLTPPDLGAKAWGEVEPSLAGGVVDAPTTSKRLYYWSLRFVSWDSSRYLAEATKALEAELEPGTPIFVNWYGASRLFG
jgi:hypothetical protein